MIFIHRPETDPFFNIATEEYVLRNIDEDVLMLWQSEASVIVGKHQNTLAEVNLDFVRDNNIPIIRRISGGGTVFHGPGNLNYTLITTGKNRERLIDFRKFTEPVVLFLQTLGIIASFEGKNNLRIEGKKFSGNSAHVYKKKVMHHGTLLVDTDMDQLEQSILPVKADIQDKAVQSVRTTVGNIKGHLPDDFTFTNFRKAFQAFLLDYFSIAETRTLALEDQYRIQKLVDEKYTQWDWNFVYSPAYTFSRTVDDISLELKVKNGIILETKFRGGFENSSELAIQLIGCKHHPQAIKSILDKVHDNDQSKDILPLFGF